MNKHFIVFFITLVMVVGTTAMAGDKGKHNHNRSKAKFVDYARVVEVEPIYRKVRISIPKEECWQEKTHRPMKYRTQHNATANIVVGGIVGGVIGHQLGHGRSRDIATVAGSVIGASIGHELANHTKTAVTKMSYTKHCNTHRRQRKVRRLDGYWVTYRYKGEHFMTRLQEKPGRRIRVMVKITPY